MYGTAMGSPVSVVVANLYMEALEQEAMATAPPHIRPRIWLRYVDDVFEVVKKDSEEDISIVWIGLAASVSHTSLRKTGSSPSLMP